MPRRGGRRFNLTSQVLAQMDMFDTGQNLPAPVNALHPVRTGARAPKHFDVDQGAAARASISSKSC